MQCPQCSTWLADDLAFCTNCGKSTDDVEEQTVIRPPRLKAAEEAPVPKKAIIISWLARNMIYALIATGIIVLGMYLLDRNNSKTEISVPTNAVNGNYSR